MNEPQRHLAAEASSPSNAAEAFAAPAADWREQLGRLIDPRATAPTSRVAVNADSDSEPFTPLALQFELREMIPRTTERWNGPTSRAIKPGQDPGSGIYRLGTRPAQRTERGWARGNLTWSNIGHQGGRLHLDGSQQRWFRQFFALHRAAAPLAVGQDASWVFFDDFVSPALWAMLHQAEALNIKLVSSGSHTPVQLHAGAVLSLDAASQADGGLHLRPRLTLDGEEVPFRDSGAISDHGLYLAARDKARAVHLASVAGGLSAAEIGLLATGDQAIPVAVPAAERDSFLADGVPALRTGFRVESVDDSVALPAPRPGTAVLTAAWQRGHRLTLSWTAEGVSGASAPVLAELLPSELFHGGVIPESWADESEQMPPVVEMRGADAAEFLHETVPRIEKLPGIEVRKTGDSPNYREASGVPTLTVTTVPSETEDWFDLGVLITVDGKTVPFAPLFRALAKGAKKLLLTDNSYLHLNHPAFTPLAELIAEGQNLEEWETGVRISRHQAAFLADFEDLADESESAVEWRALVQDVGNEYPAPVDVPTGIRAELRPYQLAGFHWLAFLWRNRLGGILADDMGLGKTLQCLTLIAWAKQGESAADGSRTRAPESRPFLVVAPTSVMTNWAAEAARFAPELRVRVRTATEAVSGQTVERDAAEADIIVTSYALFRLDYERYQEVAEHPERGIAGLILDEAQFVKNARAMGNELAEQLPVSWKLAVTGTPMENSLRELHAISQIVAPGLFPSARRFAEEYVHTIERPAPGVSVGRGAGGAPAVQARLRAQRIEQLRRRLRPFMLRRTKDLVATELPEKQEQILEIELDPGHRQLYDAFLQRERQKLFGLIADLDRNRFTVFRSLTLLRMLALDASLIDQQHDDLPSAKLEALAEHAVELAKEGRRTLVFSQFTSFLERARERLHAAGVRTVTLDGSTRGRDAVIEGFRRGEADVFLISLKAGGVGLNLTEADTVFLLDPWWNPASESQAIDRTHRIGQQKPVHVFRMIALGTIEEKVLELQRRKRALFDAVVDDEELFAQALTAADVRELLG
ncbi:MULTISPECIES: DEAD/DEAH box helicase [unclassified Leucobacter]|uniref:DEAD/DEAH box helicase n=1 Tax=unclassified Leucobacter TaxID=2621730 RepID=UPI00165E8460|nr:MULTISPECIES: DEAD/DEAH box helicase [unclassified Leucobacter]MBC9928688.1 DEAD/DEAH box helicase [Leucobacter sp. cx-169]